MRFRRCAALVVETVESHVFDLAGVLAGTTGVTARQSLQVRAAHLDDPCVVDRDDCALLLMLSPTIWQSVPEEESSRRQVLGLLDRGLLVSDDPAHADHHASDGRVRSAHWWPLSAIHYRHSRWSATDSVAEMEDRQMVTAQDLVRQLGPPPPAWPPRAAGAISLPLRPAAPPDILLQERATCRNYDAARSLPLQTVSDVLQQVLMAQATVETEPGVHFLKKNVPSAGSMHPLEAFIVARGIEGLEDGLYHYHAMAHELARLPEQPADLAAFSTKLLSGQHWFANAHVQVVLVCRFQRNFWKYRNHAKAYRAVILDAGHISQAFYTAATRQGLGAFVTAAINEAEIETLLGLDPMADGALAVCGFGWRSGEQATAELDPAGHVWTNGSLSIKQTGG